MTEVPLGVSGGHLVDGDVVMSWSDLCWAVILYVCAFVCRIVVSMTGWWFQIFFIFTPKIGEDEPILTMGWFNHQLDGYINRDHTS